MPRNTSQVQIKNPTNEEKSLLSERFPNGNSRKSPTAVVVERMNISG